MGNYQNTMNRVYDFLTSRGENQYIKPNQSKEGRKEQIEGDTKYKQKIPNEMVEINSNI